MPPPPNILLIIADDHRAQSLNGNRVNGPATPVLNNLVSGGTCFTGARIGGGNNPAVCSPSRAALFTGRPPHQALYDFATTNYRDSLRIDPANPLLGEMLRDNGHRTHLVGKWHNDYPALNRCFDSGEALFFGGLASHADPLLHDYDPTGVYDSARGHRRPGFSTEIFVDAAIRFLQEAAPSPHPFFLCIALTSPHDPRTAPLSFADAIVTTTFHCRLVLCLSIRSITVNSWFVTNGSPHTRVALPRSASISPITTP